MSATPSPAALRTTPSPAALRTHASTARSLLLLLLLLSCGTAAVTSTTADRSHRPELLEQLGKNVHAMELVHVQPMTPAEMASVRVLCWVNTYHASHATRLRAIKNTWGRKCDKILFMSDVEDLTIPTVRIAAPPLHETLWQKHREIVRLLVREFQAGAFDYVFKCDDDTFLLVENLKRYLLSPEIAAIPATQPTLLGHRMTLQWWEMERPFHPFEAHDPDEVAHMLAIKDATIAHGGLYYTPGGGGYAMNWAYLMALEQSFESPYCLPTAVVPDDWAISFCMLHHNVTPFDTRDAQHRERFHQYDPHDLFFRPFDTDAFDHALFASVYDENNWFSDHAGGIGWQNGQQCCAPDSISFHYVKPPLMELFYEFYYAGLEKP